MIFKPGLYIVSTPIGNLEDITLRALKTLNKSTIILCENIKISQKLLMKYDIKTTLQTYNEHSNDYVRKNICKMIDNGKIISLISDAGTPLISDPGYKLIKTLQILNYYIDVIPGVSSITTALVISGLPSNRFMFIGFLPKTSESKIKIFKQLLNINATLIFFDTAKRIIQSLYIALSIFGNREVCIARELTKINQEIKLGTIEDILTFYKKHGIKGEIVLFISGITKNTNIDTTKDLNLDVCKYLSQNCSAKDIINIMAKNVNKKYSKKAVYSMVNRIKSLNNT